MLGVSVKIVASVEGQQMKVAVLLREIIVYVRTGQFIAEQGHIFPTLCETRLVTVIPAEANVGTILVTFHHISDIGELSLILKGDGYVMLYSGIDEPFKS